MPPVLSITPRTRNLLLCGLLQAALLAACAPSGGDDDTIGADSELGDDGHLLQEGTPASAGSPVQGEPALEMSDLGLAEGVSTTKRLYADHPFSRVTSAPNLPTKAVTQLVTTYPNGTMWRCTGAVVGRDSVLTAAHCVYNTSRGGWAASVELTPGRVDGGLPNGRTWGRALYLSQTYRDRDAAGMGTKSEVDYAIIRTKVMENSNTQIGDRVGTLALTTVNPTASAVNWAVRFYGYPDAANPSFMYTSSDKVLSTFSSGIFTHKASSLEGLSGAAALNGSNAIFGVHVGEAPDSNYGLLITTGIRANLTDWMSR